MKNKKSDEDGCGRGGGAEGKEDQSGCGWTVYMWT